MQTVHVSPAQYMSGNCEDTELGEITYRQSVLHLRHFKIRWRGVRPKRVMFEAAWRSWNVAANLISVLSRFLTSDTYNDERIAQVRLHESYH